METKQAFSASAFEAFLTSLVSRDIPVFPVREFAHAKKHPHSIVLRHDVDISLELALKIAEVESRFKIKSTFFVLLRSPFYNVLSPECCAILRAITDLGHEVGLHWDGRELPSDNLLAVEALKYEALLLESASLQKVQSVSQHFPTTGSRLDFKNSLIDTYSPEFQRDFVYVSDSSMAWRQRDLSSVLLEPARYHLLLHPIWWAGDATSREDKLAHSQSLDLAITQRRYSEFHSFLVSCLDRREELDASFSASIQKQTN